MTLQAEDKLIDEAIQAAARWIASQEPRQDVIREVKTRFGISALEACEAAALSNKYRVWRRAHG